MTAQNQRANVAVAARALLPIALEHDLVLTHGNGPQVGLLSLQNLAYKPDEQYPIVRRAPVAAAPRNEGILSPVG